MKSHFLLSVLLSVLLLASMAHAQPKPANQLTKQDFQLALDQQLHVSDAAMVETCSAQFPLLAKKINITWNAALTALPPEIVAYRKTAQFSKALDDLKKEQRIEAKKPENKETLNAICTGLAQ